MKNLDNKTLEQPNDIVFTGIGMITAAGTGYSKNMELVTTSQTRLSPEDYYVRGFNPLPYLSDRKVVKAVSARDVLGLVAFEECVKDAGITKEDIDPNRIGLFVGAPPSSCSDNLNYAESVEQCRNAYGEIVDEEFGNTFGSANPTTLLTGLPNNVLCYGSKTLDARGPNSNYTTLETSAHMSIMGASRAMKNGRLDCAIAGGYSAHTDPLFTASMKQRGLLKSAKAGEAFKITPFEKASSKNNGTIIAEGSVFTAMEFRESAIARGAKPFATLLGAGMASDARGPFAVDLEATALTGLIQKTLKQACLNIEDVEVVLLNASGISDVDVAEVKAVQSVFGKLAVKPLYATTAPIWGNLMEAGGVGELWFLKHCYESKSIPASAMVQLDQPTRSLNVAKRTALVLRATPWGEYTCLAVRVDDVQDSKEDQTS